LSQTLQSSVLNPNTLCYYLDMISFLSDKAKDLGFIACGFSEPKRPLYFDQFSAWIFDRKNAGMSWLGRNMDVREDPSRLLSGCRTVITLAYPYPSQKPGTVDGFTVSRYSQPGEADYHVRLKGLCGALLSVLEEAYPKSHSRVCVDSAPVLERSYACSSGIGFVGKNNMLIIPRYGSYFYLAEILTTAPIDVSSIKPMENRCGTCTLCVDSCPTGALERPFYLDASKCLSYLSIEDKGRIDEETGRRMGDCFFGCDRCQEVCPFNGKEGSTQILLPSTDAFLEMDDNEFRKGFGKTAFARAGLEKLKTNIQGMRS
jgi:epoxyqueuosine reductase